MRYLEVPTGSLRASPWNVNVVSPENEAKIDESVKRHGMFKPLLCRIAPDLEYEIIGGEHRWKSATRQGIANVSIIDLGPLSDKQAKEISLLDNGRYGEDDQFKLSELLSELGTAAELALFMPYGESELTSMVSNITIALDELDITAADEMPEPLKTTKAAPTFQIMRFKVPVGDVATITEMIEKVEKRQGLTGGDSLANAGDALVHIFANLVTAS